MEDIHNYESEKHLGKLCISTARTLEALFSVVLPPDDFHATEAYAGGLDKYPGLMYPLQGTARVGELILGSKSAHITQGNMGPMEI
jgi:hypothetical protein